jgi:hypothetical protein
LITGCNGKTKKAMRKSNFALRLQPSLLEEARKLAEAEGVALNQLINACRSGQPVVFYRRAFNASPL